MKHLLLFVILAARLPAQSVFFNSNYSVAIAAAPNFNPPAGVISAGTIALTTVTSACNGYIYWNLTGAPTTGDTHGNSVSVSTGETIYAKVIGCPSAADSSVASASYTIGTSDSFAGTTGTTLPAHNANWTNIDSIYAATKIVLSGSGTAQANTTYASAGAYYAGSSSDTASMTVKPQADNGSKSVCVRCGAGHQGYAVGLTYSGGNYSSVSINKDGAGVGSLSHTWDSTVDHVIRVTAVGTTSVTVTAYVDGVLMRTIVDSTSPLPTLHSGVIIRSSSTLSTSQVANWQDN